MNRVLEVEKALRQMPPQERWEVARWLLEELQGNAPDQIVGESANDAGKPNPPLPDYSARRRRIFGDKILPNMVLTGRAEESW